MIALIITAPEAIEPAAPFFFFLLAACLGAFGINFTIGAFWRGRLDRDRDGEPSGLRNATEHVFWRSLGASLCFVGAYAALSKASALWLAWGLQ